MRAASNASGWLLPQRHAQTSTAPRCHSDGQSQGRSGLPKRDAARLSSWVAQLQRALPSTQISAGAAVNDSDSPPARRAYSTAALRSSPRAASRARPHSPATQQGLAVLTQHPQTPQQPVVNSGRPAASVAQPAAPPSAQTAQRTYRASSSRGVAQQQPYNASMPQQYTPSSQLVAPAAVPDRVAVGGGWSPAFMLQPAPTSGLQPPAAHPRSVPRTALPTTDRTLQPVPAAAPLPPPLRSATPTSGRSANPAAAPPAAQQQQQQQQQQQGYERSRTRSNGRGAQQPPPPQQQQQQQPPVALRGIIKRILHQGDKSFAIAKLQPKQLVRDDGLDAHSSAVMAARQPITVAGLMPDVYEDMACQVEGTWEQHRKFGLQLRVHQLSELAPDDRESMVRFLQARISGVGPKIAGLVVSQFEDDTIAVLDSDQAVQRLVAIRGIGAKIARKLKASWDKTSAHREQTMWLQELQGLKPGLINAISKRHGKYAREAMERDPYGATRGLPGASFSVADQVAAQLGVDPGLPSRGQAALHSMLRPLLRRDGHSYVPWGELQSETLQMLRGTGRPWPENGPEALRQCALQEDRLVLETPQFERQLPDNWGPDTRVYPQEVHSAENDVATAFSIMASNYTPPTQEQRARVEAWLEKYEKQQSRYLDQEVRLSEGQREAIITAVHAPVAILTGGPGCGKTFATQAIVRYWREEMGRNVRMCAPTGRAAQRLQEVVNVTDLDASTIHRLLKYRPRGVREAAAAEALEQAAAVKLSVDETESHGPRVYPDRSGQSELMWDSEDEYVGVEKHCEHNRSNKLDDVTAVVVDETSMVDVCLAAALLNALPIDRGCQVLFVGDADQLPPIGPGQVLRAALQSRIVPVINLREIFRQRAGSAIIDTAHRILAGSDPDWTKWRVTPPITPGNGWQRPPAVNGWQQQQQQQRPSYWGAPVDPDVPALEASLAAQAQRDLLQPMPLAAHVERVRVSASLEQDALFVMLDESAGAGDVLTEIVNVTRELLPALHDVQLPADLQVLSPTKMTAAGTPSLNEALQQILNPPRHDKKELIMFNGAIVWRVGDRVLHTVNDYDKDVYNGDLGYITDVVEYVEEDAKVTSASAAKLRKLKALLVEYPPRPGNGDIKHRVTYTSNELSEQLQLAWATTVHKAQGGEFPVVVIPLHPSFGKYLLSKTLLYTALTRARQLVVVVGTQYALDRCLRGNTDYEAAMRRRDSLHRRLMHTAEQVQLPTIEPVRFDAAAFF